MSKKKGTESKKAKRKVLLSIAEEDGGLEVIQATESGKLIRVLDLVTKANIGLYWLFYSIVVLHIARGDNPSIAVSDFLRHVDEAVEMIKGEDTLQDPEGILTHDS